MKHALSELVSESRSQSAPKQSLFPTLYCIWFVHVPVSLHFFCGL